MSRADPLPKLRSSAHGAVIDCATLNAYPKSAQTALLAQAAEIFFETANTKNFASAEAKQAFFNCWFGNYAQTQPGAFLLAVSGGEVIGYVAGCIDSFAKSSQPITRAIGYFTPAFYAAIEAYPSHYHINVKPAWQGKGTGRKLAARFAALCAEAGSPGIHIVTGAASPAVKFYEACGFVRLDAGCALSSGHALLACALDAPSKEQIRT